ncbi:MAG TPA: helicase-related protein [Myxococcota bacterium]|nr:helicase-related protein [Myxococcota bacterium]
MIAFSDQIDLGLDHTRLKDPDDGKRQMATAQEILDRFYHRRPSSRWELQILADEVGMGKTFVALAVAYSILLEFRKAEMEPEFSSSYRRVVVLTPQNPALFDKWVREVGEFVKRCVKEPFRKEAQAWFAPRRVERLDELALALRDRSVNDRVIVASMGIFSGGKLSKYDLKRRFILQALFRHWARAFTRDQRAHLLKGAPEGWPSNPDALMDEEERESGEIFTQAEAVGALGKLRDRDELDRLPEDCRAIAQPYARNRDEEFKKLDNRLTEVYRSIVPHLLLRHIPLVIVDEAHNWKNHKNGYDRFIEVLAPRTRRALLLTATPFQLRPEEILSVLQISDHMGIGNGAGERKERQEHLRKHREETIRPVLERSELCSRAVAKAWRRLPVDVSSADLDRVWRSPALVTAREQLHELATKKGTLDEKAMRAIVDPAVAPLDPNLRELVRVALQLYAYNADYSQELGALVVRHRRRTQHRAFLVGREYPAGVSAVAKRSDRHLIHSSPGIDVRGEGELPHYLLMRCVSLWNKGRGKTALGSELTGCYSTLLHSEKGRKVDRELGATGKGKAYLDLLRELVSPEQDPQHPKVKAMAERVMAAWRAGEKTLIFCFRLNTAERLRDILDEHIRKELARRRERCLGGKESLKALRSRLQGRDRDLITLGLDRVLWSWYWGRPEGTPAPFDPEDLDLQGKDFGELAKLSLSYRNEDFRGEKVDRVFLNRATEHVLAHRLLHLPGIDAVGQALLERMVDPMWVKRPYGDDPDVDDDQDEDGDEGAERAEFDERGIHTVYERKAAEPGESEVAALAAVLEDRWKRTQTTAGGIFGAYSQGPSLWLGADPRTLAVKDRAPAVVRALHRELQALTTEDGETGWSTRRLVLQALRRTLLRESVLLRLLPERSELAEEGWGHLLVERFFAPLEGQVESMADRMVAFLGDLRAASGDASKTDTARGALLEATRFKDKYVALVTGSQGKETRSRIFIGFNTPLQPEILICTSVGQEGIDLHRHCRNVIHYDLAWNPAVLEQRTGRTDRIGSKADREHARQDGAFLEIGLPFLAGTYDERMFEELRLRAQAFEFLTGGDLAAADREGSDEHDLAEGASGQLDLIPLPESMVEDLRVKLHVW